MPIKEWAWIVLVSGSAVAFVLGVVFFILDRTWVLLPFGIVTVLCLRHRPANWREILYKLF